MQNTNHSCKGLTLAGQARLVPAVAWVAAAAVVFMRGRPVYAAATDCIGGAVAGARLARVIVCVAVFAAERTTTTCLTGTAVHARRTASNLL